MAKKICHNVNQISGALIWSFSEPFHIHYQRVARRQHCSRTSHHVQNFATRPKQGPRAATMDIWWHRCMDSEVRVDQRVIMYVIALFAGVTKTIGQHSAKRRRWSKRSYWKHNVKKSCQRHASHFKRNRKRGGLARLEYNGWPPLNEPMAKSRCVANITGAIELFVTAHLGGLRIYL